MRLPLIFLIKYDNIMTAHLMGAIVFIKIIKDIDCG